MVWGVLKHPDGSVFIQFKYGAIIIFYQIITSDLIYPFLDELSQSYVIFYSDM